MDKVLRSPCKLPSISDIASQVTAFVALVNKVQCMKFSENPGNGSLHTDKRYMFFK